jgi:hypothetical protein
MSNYGVQNWDVFREVFAELTYIFPHTKSRSPQEYDWILERLAGITDSARNRLLIILFLSHYLELEKDEKLAYKINELWSTTEVDTYIKSLEGEETLFDDISF